MPDDLQATNWFETVAETDLIAGRPRVARVQDRQIALFRLADGRIKACDNRCPHEGYPLSEGDMGGENGCTLTCNWHNWKFDLDSGETLIGGDTLQRYDTRIRDGVIEVEVMPVPPEITAGRALDGMVAGFERHEYDRFAREIARLSGTGADPLDAVRRAIAETADRFEYGASHALPATADWLSLRAERPEDAVFGLAALTESVGHFAWDTRRHPRIPYPEGQRTWDADAFVDAIEREDEADAAALVRGAVAAGLDWPDMEPGFARAALAHYADFGHSAIYTYKMRALTAGLGDRESLLSLSLLLARSLVYQSREDLIPEFRQYGAALDSIRDGATEVPLTEELRHGSVRQILDRIAAGAGAPEATFESAYHAAAWQLLHYDLGWQSRTDNSVSQNVGWLDFTHGLTFANAARKLAEANPALWPAALLQIGCFLGRNSGFTDAGQSVGNWWPSDTAADAAACIDRAIDHGQGEYIVACHLLKLSFAIREELQERPAASGHDMAVAALRRFMNSPLKRRHTLRTARQALDFVG